MSVAATETNFQAYSTITTYSYEMDLDDAFNDILASMDSDEQEVLQFDINNNYDMMKMIFLSKTHLVHYNQSAI